MPKPHLPKLIILALLLAIFLSSFTTLITIANRLNTSSEDAKALFGGEPEDGYVFLGYMIIENLDDTRNLCGMNFLTPSIMITAAHCIENGYEDLYLNTGKYTDSYESTSYELKQTQLSPDYDGMFSTADAAIDDIAIIEIENRVRLTEYAQVASPEIGCDYYITGYGTNEAGVTIDRLGGSVCISSITEDRIELAPGNTFFCTGDSGSGIYEKDTNKLVGIVSAYSPPGECPSASSFYAARVDASLDFISDYVNGTIADQTPEIDTIPPNIPEDEEIVEIKDKPDYNPNDVINNRSVGRTTLSSTASIEGYTLIAATVFFLLSFILLFGFSVYLIIRYLRGPH